MELLKGIDFLTLLFFVVPGFISMRVYGMLRPTGSGPLKENIYEAVTFSVINYALMEWTVPLVRRLGATWDDALLRSLLLLLAFVLVPGLLSFLLNYALGKMERGGRILRRAETAWDEFFLRRQSCWIIVHLKDGRRMGGFFGARSFASLYPNSGHLYVQELWKLGSNGEFEEKIENSQGIILRPDDYQMVEVFKEA